MANETLERGKRAAQEEMEKAKQMATAKMQHAKDMARAAHRDTVRYTQDHPEKALGSAFGTGVLIGLLLALILGSRR
jgi:ElaB/YqjD/DUF883 family membrane-anchored ribosome-binding protein